MWMLAWRSAGWEPDCHSPGAPAPPPCLTGTPPKFPGSPLFAHSLHELSHSQTHTHKHARTHALAGSGWMSALFPAVPCCSIRGFWRSSSWQFGWKRSEGRRKEVRDGVAMALFSPSTWKTLPRLRVLLLRLFGPSLFAPPAVLFSSFY